MPATYAHYKMGMELAELLPPREREIVRKHKNLFLIGVHGPDIFFYYHPFLKNKVNQIGSEMHDRPGADFFSAAVKVVRRKQFSPAHLAYLYGFLCHFALDVTCHGYITEKMEKSGLSHSEIETEFDRALMLGDGQDPIRYRQTSHIDTGERAAAVIRDFFDELSVRQVQRALKGMVRCHNLLRAPSRGKRWLIDTVLKLVGKYPEMHGLVVNYRANEACSDSTAKLFFLYRDALELAFRLICEFDGVLQQRTALSDIFRYDFGSRLPQPEAKGA